MYASAALLDQYTVVSSAYYFTVRLFCNCIIQVRIYHQALTIVICVYRFTQALPVPYIF